MKNIIKTNKRLNEKINEIKEICNDKNVVAIAGLLQIMESDKLAPKVFAQLGGKLEQVESMLEIGQDFKDIANYGVNKGFKGFMYDEELAQFFDNNKDEILERISEQAKEFDYKNELDMVNNFNYIKQNNLNITVNDIAKVCNNKGADLDDKSTKLKNVLAWYLAEDISRQYDISTYDKENIDIKFIEKANLYLQNYANRKIHNLKKQYTKENTNEMSM